MAAQRVIDDFYITPIQTAEQVAINSKLYKSNLYLCTDDSVDKG